MLYFLNKNNIIQLILSVLLFVWAVFTIVSNMVLCPPDGQTLLYNSIFEHWSLHPYLYKSVAVLWVLLECVFIQMFYNFYKFSDSPTFMPILVFLLFLNAGKFLTMFTPAYISLFLLTLIMFVNTKDKGEKLPKNEVFASGILIGITTLLDPNALAIFLFLVLALFANHYSKTKEIIILFAGLLIVALYTFTYYFLIDKLPELGLSISHLQFFYVVKNVKALGIMDWILMAVVCLSLFYVVAAVKLYFDNKLIILRKRFATIVILLFVLLLCLFTACLPIRQGLIYLIIPMTLLYSMLSLKKKKRFFNDLVLIAVVVLLCL